LSRPIRVLIASASAGTGHVRAAEAVRLAFSARGDVARADHVDVLDLAPRWLRSTYAGGFELLAARAPRVWGELYHRTDGETDAARWGAVSHRMLFAPFRRLLLESGWDMVVCTHFLPAQLAAGQPGMPPFALVATDFTIHRFWAQRRVARFFVATGDAAADLRRRAPWALITPTGIPVDPSFSHPPHRHEARERLGLRPEAPVALVMGGGLGIGIADMARGVAAAPVPGLQVVVLAGANHAAQVELAPLATSARIRVLGYVKNVHELMAAADVVVSKPGGLTTSEALAMGCPLVVTRAMPGHEEANAREVVRHGAGIHAPRPHLLGPALAQLFNDPAGLRAMALAARRMGRPNAAARIAAAVVRQVGARDAA
jgi:processive 1,2-diacylglycerol beta-glucosyltransferase